MTTTNKTVRIFMMPLTFPCGPQSSCCGPIGQTEEEIQSLKSTIEKETACQVEVLNVTNGNDMRNHLQIVRFVHSFGAMALPIIALDGEVVSLGFPTPEQAISAIKEKMNQV
ncbi:MAG: hypothetical protein ACE5LA_01840 [Dehalococcoidales bacterium]